MAQSVQDAPPSLPSWTDAVDGVLRRTASKKDIAAEIAELLKAQFVTAGMTGCRLDGTDGPVVALASAGGSHAAETAERLTRRLEEWASEDDGIAPLTSGENGRAWVGVFGHIVYRGESRGVIVVAVPDGHSEDELQSTRSRLEALAKALAVCMAAECSDRQVQKMREEQRALTDMVTVGEAMVSLLHGLNNSLNTMMLQAAVVQLKVDEPLRQEVGLIRREGAAVAARMRPLMQFREQRRQNRSVVDLHAALREFLADAPAVVRGAATRLDAPRSRVAAHASDVRRLLHYLASVAAPSAGGGPAAVRLRTVNHENELQLVVEPSEGTDLSSPEAGRPFDPYNEAGNPDCLLERLALDSLLRLVGGSLRTYPLPDGRITTVVGWPVAG